MHISFDHEVHPKLHGLDGSVGKGIDSFLAKSKLQ